MKYELRIDGEVLALARVDGATVDEVWVNPAFRRQGLGRRLMKWVCNDADAAGATLRLFPLGELGAMSTDQLYAWYARFGFVTETQDSYAWMMRRPRKIPQPVASLLLKSYTT
jgi:GNAT superfamily N-acetyltransferase